ncbi:type II toxin-antitoxin system HicA family toxin [Microcoleus sp. FACHB-831]|uniref:type II toxin-antitoxin system HicA family toxin n=1 Tax=Microcoleus sp. FACHB-831 TaxID=2692827 RepID=UPI0016827D90|nr:type II toxin-antitoxin system HicA family toxin [Microcoleus sp. FACHB-831]MBD1923191.1 type II toxin-antitoxin system HicA family toxin [Microcoleus sp. FACHB-831]
MPKKIRELKSMLRKAGFTYRPGKGSHTVWSHPLLPGEPITLAGKDGDDAKLYLEKEVNQRLEKLEDLL